MLMVEQHKNTSSIVDQQATGLTTSAAIIFVSALDEDLAGSAVFN